MHHRRTASLRSGRQCRRRCRTGRTTWGSSSNPLRQKVPRRSAGRRNCRTRAGAYRRIPCRSARPWRVLRRPRGWHRHRSRTDRNSRIAHATASRTTPTLQRHRRGAPVRRPPGREPPPAAPATGRSRAQASGTVWWFSCGNSRHGMGHRRPATMHGLASLSYPRPDQIAVGARTMALPTTFSGTSPDFKMVSISVTG